MILKQQLPYTMYISIITLCLPDTPKLLHGLSGETEKLKIILLRHQVDAIEDYKILRSGSAAHYFLKRLNNKWRSESQYFMDD